MHTYDLTQQDVEDSLITEVRTLRFVDLRFRGLVHIDKSEINNYYQQKFLPEVQSRGGSEPPSGRSLRSD